MTDPVLFYLLKEEPEEFPRFLAQRATDNTSLFLKRAELGKETLNMYVYPSGRHSPKITLEGGDEESGWVHFYDDKFAPESYIDWHTLKTFFRWETGEKKQDGIAFTCHDALRGKIGTQISKHQKITVMQYGVLKMEGNEFLPKPMCYFFDETPQKGFKRQYTLDLVFDVYQFLAVDGRTVLLLVKKEAGSAPLPLDELIIEGNLVELEDLSLIGNKKMLNVKLPVFILTKYTNSKNPFSNISECKTALDKLSVKGDGWFDYLFLYNDGHTYRCIREFEWLVSAFLLSKKVGGYPLHLLLIGVAGTGKTTILETINMKLEPNSPVIEGGVSTIKTLTPSFKGILPEPGAILQTNRLLCIDEFLRLLNRQGNHPEQKTELLAAMNSLLEHRSRLFGSGNGKIKGQMTSRLFAVTNPPGKVETFEQLSNQLENSFLSRVLIWWQTRREVTLVHQSKGKKECNLPFTDVLVRVCDLFQSLTAEFNPEVVKAVYDKHNVWLQDSTLKDVYGARYGKHHILCLIDGIVKTRVLVSGGELKAEREDYIMLEHIWDLMVDGWQVERSGAFSGMAPPKVIQ